MKINLKKNIVTECGRRVHYVGMGICGLPVVQIEFKEKDIWFLAKVSRLRTAKTFGSGAKFYLINEEVKRNEKT